jgi:hypothetical protein
VDWSLAATYQHQALHWDIKYNCNFIPKKFVDQFIEWPSTLRNVFFGTSFIVHVINYFLFSFHWKMIGGQVLGFIFFFFIFSTKLIFF